MEMRIDITVLRETDVDLAREFESLREKLDSDDPEEIPTDEESAVTYLASQASQRQKDEKDFQSVLTKIRSLKELSAFRYRPSNKEMMALAASGPIVVFNITDFRSDAFLVQRQSIDILPLDNLHFRDLQVKVSDIRHGLNQVAWIEHYLESRNKLSKVLKWLWDAAVGPVLEHLGFTEIPKCKTKWPHVWWVTSGWLSLLPLHAAGYHSRGSSNNALDRVISSYSPTIKALDYARKKAAVSPADADQKVLLVAVSKTVNHDDLPHAETEIDAVDKLLPLSISRIVLRGGPPDTTPTKANVRSHLRDATIAHFSCHGEYNPSDPCKSGLLLQDDSLSVADITCMSQNRAQLAYLSGCHTANHRVDKLLDESIHLSGACQIAGYPYVVGSLWQINDEHSADVAKTVYRFMLKENAGINSSKAAEGLHWAVRKLRDETRKIPGLLKATIELEDNPFIWAPYIHSGA